MNILGSFMVPHPPLIVGEVGRGREEQIEKTKESYISVAEEIANLNPDTIVISSPHAPLYNDSFYVSGAKELEGSFSNFGASEVKFNEEVDIQLVEEIKKISEKTFFPVTVKKEKELDHGTMVPLYFIRKKLPKTKIVVVGLSGISLIANYQFGMLIRSAIANTNRRVVFVASGDLSHKLQEYGPYGFIKEGPIYDERIMKTMSGAKFNELLEYGEELLSLASECGHRSFTIMAGALDGYDVEAKQYSHEDITGVGYGICSFYPTNINNEREFKRIYLTSNDPCVTLAKKSIKNYLNNKEYIEPDNSLPTLMLEKQAGTFVSIHKYGHLRGCIGTILPTRENLAKEIIANAVSAAFNDFRFSPITEDELEDLEINVDILNESEEVSSVDELDPKKYGIIVSQEYKRGVLLPDIEGVETIEQQIEIAKKKAGITDGKYYLEKFTVTRHR